MTFHLKKIKRVKLKLVTSPLSRRQTNRDYIQTSQCQPIVFASALKLHEHVPTDKFNEPISSRVFVIVLEKISTTTSGHMCALAFLLFPLDLSFRINSRLPFLSVYFFQPLPPFDSRGDLKCSPFFGVIVNALETRVGASLSNSRD